MNGFVKFGINVFWLSVHYNIEFLIKDLKIINLINMIGRTSKDHITIKDVPAESFIQAFAE